ncbi:NAD-dependent epimerase/dehydratase family protein [Jatrophihabitans sp. YIM 134969]
MSRHLIVGAGGVGRATATALLDLDPSHEVVLASRSGTGPDLPGVRRLAVDATDSRAVTEAAEGFDVVYNALNPPSYNEWEQQWPPMAEAILAAAAGKTLVTMGNLYVFDEATRTMAEDTPMRPNGHKGELRRVMTEKAFAAHAAGTLRYTEARASDYFGPGTTTSTSYVTATILPRARRGKHVFMLTGDVDAPHTWTYVPDVGRTLATLGTDARAVGRVWHVPSNPAKSPREVAADVARLSGAKTPGITTVPWPLVRTAGIAVPFLRELGETRHQFTEPYLLESQTTQRELGLAPTPWDDALRAALAATA